MACYPLLHGRQKRIAPHDLLGVLRHGVKECPPHLVHVVLGGGGRRHAR
jgi:hypothetical protein